MENRIETEFRRRMLGLGGIRHSNHSYEKGMFISLSNSKMYYYQLQKTFKQQYQSVLRSVGIKVGKGSIQQTNRMPAKDKFKSLIQKGYPIAIACIHDNPDAETDGKHYQHCHLWVYNISHFLPSDPENLRDSIGKVRGYVSRYIGNKHKRRGVHIEPVGHYKHYPEQDLLDHDFHDYLRNLLNSPRRDCLFNYMRHNKHNPDVNYDLTFLYPDLKFLPINLKNRTITTK